MGQPIVFTRSMIASNTTAVATSQSPGAGLVTLNSTTVTLDTQRRVVIASTGNDSGISFTVSGTNQAGNPIADKITGGNATSVITNQDFLTISSILPSGSVASTLTVGTGNTGSSLWQILNWNVTPTDLSIAVELRSGAATYGIEYTLDDPNILPGTGGLNAAGLTYPLPFADGTLNGASGNGHTTYQVPILAFRLTTQSGTGTLVCRAIQAGLGSP